MNTGGPAFPTGTWEYDGQNNVLPYQDHGMTMLDYFAAKAMQGVLADGHTMWDSHLFQGNPDAVAEFAYVVAASMIKHRGSLNNE